MTRAPAFLVGLIGSGIGSSRTPAMHEREGARQGLGYTYNLIDLTVLGLGVEALPHLLENARRAGFAGLNITHPCKQAVIPLLDELSDEAAAIGAVNTVVFRDDRAIGHNTDWWGFTDGFQRALPGADLGRVLQLGAGGAGAAVAYALLRMGVAHLEILDIDQGKAEGLAASLNARFGPRIEVAADEEHAAAVATGLVQTTPVGMDSHPGLPLPADAIRPEHWAAECIYFPLETEFLRVARARGCRTVDGTGMAVGQAVRAFQLFTGRKPDADAMRRDLFEI